MALRKQVISIKGEVMIEQATAMIYRSCFAEGRQVSPVNHLKKCGTKAFTTAVV